MKKNWRMILLVVWLISGLCLLNGCLTAWVTNTQQTRGNFYGALPVQQAVHLEKNIIRNDFERGHFENTLEKERMLNTYVRKQLDGGTTIAPSETQGIRGLGYVGLFKNYSQYYRYAFQIRSLSDPGSFQPISFDIPSGGELLYKLPPGTYQCTVFKDGVQWGSSSIGSVDGREKMVNGRWVYWGCTRE